MLLEQPSAPPSSTPSPPSHAAAFAWVRVWAAVCLGAIVLLFAPTLWQLVQVWNADPNYSHGFFVVPFTLFLVVRHLRAHPATEEGNWLLAALTTAAGIVLHAFTVVSGFLLLDFPALFLVLRGLAIGVGGRSWANGLTLPLLFLFFMFPLPVAWTSAAALVLQDIVAKIAGGVLSMFFVTFRQGNSIHIAGLETPLHVAEECSGLRQLVAFLALGAAFAYFCKRPWYVRLTLLLASVPVAILANVLRVILMAVGARWFGVAWLGSWMHHVPAFLTLPVGLALFFGIASLLGGFGKESEAEGPAKEPGVGGAPGPHNRAGVFGVLVSLAFGGGLMAALHVHLQAGEGQTYPDLAGPLAGLPLEVNGTKAEGVWKGLDRSGDARLRSTIKFSHQEMFSRLYGTRGGPTVDLYMVYSREGEDRKHHPEICMRDVGGMPEVREDRAVLQLGKDKDRSLMRFCFRSGLDQFTTVYYWHYTFEPQGREETLLQRLHRKWSTRAPSITVQVAMAGRGADRKIVEDRFLPLLDRLLRAHHLPTPTRMGCERLPIAVLRD